MQTWPSIPKGVSRIQNPAMVSYFIEAAATGMNRMSMSVAVNIWIEA